MPNDQTHTRALAAFAAQLQFEDLPASTVSHAKRCILDALGCGIYGSHLQWTQILASTVE